MIGLLRGELIKLRTTRTAIGFALCALALVLLAVLLTVLVGEPDTAPDKVAALALSAPIALILAIFGAVGATGEHRHGTITAALLIAPDRIRVTVAKLIAYGLAGGLVGLALQVIAIVVGLPLLIAGSTLGADPGVGDVAGLLLRSFVNFALLTAVGVGIGALVRNQVAAVVGLLVYLFIAEPLLTLAWDGVEHVGLGGASDALSGSTVDPGIAPGLAALVLVGWAALAGTAAVLADRSRDVN